MAKILIKRGLQSAVESLVLSEGELALAKDTGNLYAGTESGTVHLNPKGGTADVAQKLAVPREFSITGDATAPGVSFDGSANVALALTLASIPDLTPGTFYKVTVDEKGRVTNGASALTAEDIPSLPSNKITGLGTAAALDTGNTAGKVVVVAEDGKIDPSLMPDLAINDVFEAEDEDAMLALEAQKGDICIRTDESKTYILADEPASTLENWKWLKTPDCKVISVNGQTGAITITADSLGAVPTTRTVNGKPLSSDVTLTAEDVGARDSSWVPSATDVGAVPTSRTVNGKPLSEDVTLAAADVNAVPVARTVNGKPLSKDITLAAGDVGAAAAAHTSVEAGADTLGHVKIGDGLTVSAGVVSLGDVDGGTF